MTKADLKVSDLKQYYYCPRVVYYQYVMPVDRKTTYKMDKGKEVQDQIEILEARRKLKAYGLQNGKRKFNLWLKSEKHGLSGKIDMLIETDQNLFPVDFKFTRGRPRKNHLYQLGGYALILEDRFRRRVDNGFIYLITQKDAVVFDLTDSLKADCIIPLRLSGKC
jgi:CRISPR-associated exonuclease Cas4